MTVNFRYQIRRQNPEAISDPTKAYIVYTEGRLESWTLGLKGAKSAISVPEARKTDTGDEVKEPHKHST